MSEHETALFERPSPGRTAPHRGAANFYRSAADGDQAVAGVPLDSVEAAVVAAVRMGYKIAAAQVDRTERLGRRLRQAGDKAAGPGSDRQALDATEQLVFRAMIAGLSWLEGVSTDRGNPLKRLATAEYRILGSLLGLMPSDKPNVRNEPPSDENTDDARGSQASRKPRPARLPPQIRHEGERRAVQVLHWELAAGAAPDRYPVTFYGTQPSASTIEGALIVGRKSTPTLILKTPREAASGPWKAAICDREGLQVGYIEIAL